MTFGAASVTWAAIYGLAGALAGSFIAALVLRWLDDRSVLRGRSTCDSCGKTLRAWELVPIVSALTLRGRCARCGVRIDPVHGRIEILGALIGLSAGWVAGPEGWTGALFGWTLLALGALDGLALWLPDRLTVLLAGAGLATGALGFAPLLGDRIVGGLAGFGVLWAIAMGYRHVRGREGMGGGDPKLFGAIGLWLGWRMLPGVLLAACVAGLGYMLLRRMSGGRVAADDMVPLGLMLAVAAYPCWVLMIASGA